ncbi:thioredoxin-disulfide reductase [Lachnospiraceae bacterium ZAX-1]
MIYDVIIVGSGPAGLSASIYGQRAMLHTLVLEKQPMSGGQILNTDEVDNYPGIPGIGGFELGMKFRSHADSMGAVFLEADVESLKAQGEVKQIITNKGIFETKAVIFATGATHRKLNVPGELELCGMGVSYCATCDGAFFKDKVTAVVGGGDVALEDALFLARGCKKVYLVHRRDALRGAKALQEKVFETGNIEIIWNSQVVLIKGEHQVKQIELLHCKEETKKNISVDGVFIAVGLKPNSSEVGEVVLLDQQGYIVAGEDTKTNIPGVFAAGDVRTKQLRQVITAAADGANAITAAEHYLNGM